MGGGGGGGVFGLGFLFLSFKNLTSVDLPEKLERFLVLDILKIINYGVYVSSLLVPFFHLFLYLIHQSFILSVFFIWTQLQVFKRCLLASRAGIKANECSCTWLFNFVTLAYLHIKC